MNKLKTATSMILMTTTIACAARAQQPQRVQPEQEAQAPQQTVQPIAPTTEISPKASRWGDTDRLMEQKRAAIDQQKKAIDRQQAAIETLKKTQAIMPRSGLTYVPANGTFFAGGSSDSPLLLVTAPMDERTRTDWKEDLNIMYKLLRDAIDRSGNSDAQAMGIRVQTVGTAAPIYVEDCGLIFRVSVNFALASSGAAPATKPTEATSRPSAWEATRRQLSGELEENREWLIDGQGRLKTPARPSFDPAKVDALIDSIAAQLPEASHFRHLQPDEQIFVSVSGTDDAGAARRLTMKARKSDIDEAASGKIKTDEFKQRVARSIN